MRVCKIVCARTGVSIDFNVSKKLELEAHPRERLIPMSRSLDFWSVILFESVEDRHK